MLVWLCTMAANSIPVPIAVPNTVPDITQELVLSTGPSVSLNVPAGHCAHLPVAVTVPVKPGPHKQFSISVLPATATEWAGHSSHRTSPSPIL